MKEVVFGFAVPLCLELTGSLIVVAGVAIFFSESLKALAV